MGTQKWRKHEPGMNVQKQILMVWEEVGVWPWLWQLIMTPYDSISFQNYKAIMFVRFKDQITLRGINAIFQSSVFLFLFIFFIIAETDFHNNATFNYSTYEFSLMCIILLV